MLLLGMCKLRGITPTHWINLVLEPPQDFERRVCIYFWSTYKRLKYRQHQGLLLGAYQQCDAYISPARECKNLVVIAGSIRPEFDIEYRLA